MPDSPRFPLLYHAHHSLHMEDLPFWAGLAARQNGPVLELGCGTGRVLLPLAQAGFPAYGFDNDPAMLSVLRRRLQHSLAGEPGLIVNTWLGDMTRFHVAPRFGLIYLPCNTFSTLPSPARRAMLEHVGRGLSPAGLFAASLPNPTLLRKLPAGADPEVEEIFDHPLDAEPVQVSSGWERTGDRFRLIWHYDHLLPNGRVERLSAHVQHYLEKPETYLEELRSTGFHSIEIFGDYEQTVYTPRSPHLILLASHSS